MTELTYAPSGDPPRRVSDSARGTIIAGMSILAVFFGGFGTWAALAPLDSAVIALGVVKVEGNRKTVKHLDGGIVKELLVKEGDRVEKGQVLIRLDETDARARIDIFSGQYDSLKALESRLLAERDGLDTIRFPDFLLDRAGDDNVFEMLAGQINVFETRRASLAGQIAVLQQRIAQLRTQIGGFQAQKRSQERQLELIREELAGTRELHEKGYAPKTRVLALERKAASIEGESGELIADIARTRQAIGEAKLQIAQLQKERLAEATTELRDVQTRLGEVEPRLGWAKEMLSRTELAAPEAGYVLGLTAFTVGGVIAPGERVLDIVPADNTLIIEARIQPSDIDDVYAGMPAEVQLTAYKRRVVPTVDGVLTWVSADRLTDDRSGEAYYVAYVEIDPESLAEVGEIRLYPGMPAQVMIATGARTAFDYLIGPLTSSFDRAFREQ